MLFCLAAMEARGTNNFIFLGIMNPLPLAGEGDEPKASRVRVEFHASLGAVGSESNPSCKVVSRLEIFAVRSGSWLAIIRVVPR
jgi:hypothetical protein